MLAILGFLILLIFCSIVAFLAFGWWGILILIFGSIILATSQSNDNAEEVNDDSYKGDIDVTINNEDMGYCNRSFNKWGK